MHLWLCAQVISRPGSLKLCLGIEGVVGVVMMPDDVSTFLYSVAFLSAPHIWWSHNQVIMHCFHTHPVSVQGQMVENSGGK